MFDRLRVAVLGFKVQGRSVSGSSYAQKIQSRDKSAGLVFQHVKQHDDGARAPKLSFVDFCEGILVREAQTKTW